MAPAAPSDTIAGVVALSAAATCTPLAVHCGAPAADEALRVHVVVGGVPRVLPGDDRAGGAVAREHRPSLQPGLRRRQQHAAEHPLPEARRTVDALRVDLLGAGARVRPGEDGAVRSVRDERRLQLVSGLACRPPRRSRVHCAAPAAFTRCAYTSVLPKPARGSCQVKIAPPAPSAITLGRSWFPGATAIAQRRSVPRRACPRR